MLGASYLSLRLLLTSLMFIIEKFTVVADVEGNPNYFISLSGRGEEISAPNYDFHSSVFFPPNKYVFEVCSSYEGTDVTRIRWVWTDKTLPLSSLKPPNLSDVSSFLTGTKVF